MSISNENKKNRDKEVNFAKTKDTPFVEPTKVSIAEDIKNESTSLESNKLIQDTQREQRDVYNAILDESERNVERATEEAKNQIPKFTEAVNTYQHETLKSARDIASNQINAQREIVSSLQNSWIPYWERSYALFWEFMSPQRIVEIYTNFMGSFADSTITATRLANNSLLGILESAKEMMGQAKRTSDDLTRASSNIAKKMQKDSRDLANAGPDREVRYNVESRSREDNKS